MGVVSDRVPLTDDPPCKLGMALHPCYPTAKKVALAPRRLRSSRTWGVLAGSGPSSIVRPSTSRSSVSKETVAGPKACWFGSMNCKNIQWVRHEKDNSREDRVVQDRERHGGDLESDEDSNRQGLTGECPLQRGLRCLWNPSDATVSAAQRPHQAGNCLSAAPG